MPCLGAHFRAATHLKAESPLICHTLSPGVEWIADDKCVCVFANKEATCGQVWTRLRKAGPKRIRSNQEVLSSTSESGLVRSFFRPANAFVDFESEIERVKRWKWMASKP